MNISATTTATEIEDISDIDARRVIVASTLMFLMGVFQVRILSLSYFYYVYLTYTFFIRTNKF